MTSLSKKIISWLSFFFILFFLLFASFPLPGVIPVLMYHYVGSVKDAGQAGNYISRESFEWQLAFLKKFGYRVISLEDYEAILTGKRKPRGRELVITFDDGDISFETEAVPILERYNFPVTMFLISDRIKLGWPGSMTKESIEALRQKYPWLELEGHTKTHAHLSEISDTQLEDELVTSKKDLENLLNKPIRYLAYPFGQFDERCLKVVQKAGYHLAFTTSHKKLGRFQEGPLSMTRIKINRVSDPPIVFWYHISGLHQIIKSAVHGFYQHFDKNPTPSPASPSD